ncbi:MAG: MGMT family protein [Lysobacterales bacterium]
MNPDYREAIYAAVKAIPAGKTCAYQDVARLAGLPGRARLVGRALRELPKGHQLPWYRVTRADRSLAFDTGSPDFQRQRNLLLDEGVVLVRNRVPSEHYNWENDVDFALWGPPPD